MLHKLLEHISEGQNSTDINIMVICVSNGQLKENNIKKYILKVHLSGRNHYSEFGYIQSFEIVFKITFQPILIKMT